MNAADKTTAMADPIHASDSDNAIKQWGSMVALFLTVVGAYRVLAPPAKRFIQFFRDLAALPGNSRKTHALVTGLSSKLDLHLSASGVASFHCDANAVVIDSSKDWERIANQGHRDAVAGTWLDLFVQDEREAVVESWKRAVAGGISFFFTGHIQSTPDMNPLQVQVRCVPVTSSDGKQVWFGILRETS